MEDGDESALKNWRVWRELSIKKYEEEYARLNVHFDVYTGESEVKPEYQTLAFQKLEEKGLLAEVDGAKLIDLEKYKLGKAVVRKRGWSPFLFSAIWFTNFQFQTVLPSTSLATSLAPCSDTKSINSTK
jgi:hypothetical protein